MTDGSPPPDDPIDALHDLGDALADLVVAVRRVAQAGSVVFQNPEARDAIAGMLTMVVDAVTAAAAGTAAEPGN